MRKMTYNNNNNITSRGELRWFVSHPDRGGWANRTPVTQVEWGAGIRSPSNKKGELVQLRLFRATPCSRLTLNHYTMENPTPSPPLRSAIPVHASP